MKNDITRIIFAIFSFLIFVPYAHADFSDVADSQYKNAIESLAADGVIEGYEDGTYRPDQKINRAEFTKIVIASNPLFDSGEISDCEKNYTVTNWGYVYFPDVVREQWYTPYICTAKIKGVVKGYDDGNYKPAQNIAYSEALKIIYETYEDAGDATQTENWYAPYLGDAKANKIDLGISPAKEITRGEMAQLISNFLDKKEIKNPADQVNPEDFFLYKNTKWGFEIMLPNKLKSYKISYQDLPWTNCNNELYTLMEMVPPRQYELGFKSYEEIGKFMPFNIGRMDDAKICTNGMLNLFSRDSWCANEETTCGIYKNIKFIKKDDYLLEFIPLYQDGFDTTNLLYLPEEGELEYMRASFKLID